ncbi:hypothetical protein UlMin_012589 [Ulmus minor]
MAKGRHSEEFLVLSQVRTGLKREFAFALKVQSEMQGTLGRTRARKPDIEDLDNSTGKKLKASPSMAAEKEAEKDLKPCSDRKVGEDGNLRGVDAVEHSGEEASVALEEACENRDGQKLQNGAMVEALIAPRSANGGEVDKVEDSRELTPPAPKPEQIDSIEPSTDEPVCKDMPMAVIAEKIVSQVPSTEQKAATPIGDVHEVEDSRELIPLAPKPEQIDSIERSTDAPVCKDMPMEVIAEKIAAQVPSMEEKAATPIGDVDKKSPAKDEAALEKPSRRFTRSALKQNVKNSLAKDDAGEGDVNVGSPLVTLPSKLDMRMQNSRKRFPAKLKDLLETGILEGQAVRYIRSSKAKGLGDGLRGVIKGSSILCHCDKCEGAELVTPTVYELHAGSANKRPPEYTYLDNDNGVSLRDVMTACQNTPLVALDETVERIVGCSLIGKCTKCFNCRESIPQDGSAKAMLLCNSCVDFEDSQPKAVETASHNHESPKIVTVPKPSSPNLSKCSSSQNKSQGRITRKDLRLHKLVFREDVLPDGTEVGYFARGQKMLGGYKMGSGIICSCCDSEVSPSQFESHAGWASRRKPYLHIYTSNGVSLHELALSLSRDQKFAKNDNDDLCSSCREGGDLLCCDGCPRAYHPGCVFLPSIPTDTWYCKHCQNLFEKEKHVERNADAVAAGRVPGIDPIEQITNRCIRIINAPNAGGIEFGGCALCRGHDFSKSGFDSSTVLFCDQCEREFHVGCLKDHGMQDLQELPEGKWFCTPGCERIHLCLQKLIIYGEESLPEFLLDTIRKKHKKEGSESDAELQIKWMILNWKLASNDAKTELLLSEADSLFHDQFTPITDAATKHDLIPAMLYGTSISGQDFSGMHCAILTVNGSVVSAGLFRIYGTDVAELPLVATSAKCQGQGYFQTLFACLERFLSFLNVKLLVLPAADEAISIWTKKFNFKRVPQDKLNELRSRYQLMIFQGTPVLGRPIPRCQIHSKEEAGSL